MFDFRDFANAPESYSKYAAAVDYIIRNILFMLSNVRTYDLRASSDSAILTK